MGLLSGKGFKVGQKTLTAAAIAAFLVSIFEFLFMISPFIAYFYALFSPLLNILQSTWILAWLTDFYLSHISDVLSSTPIVYPLSRFFFFGGLALFLTHVAYLYWMKYMRKQLATGLLYRWIRHPQYLGFMIAGLGGAMRWPRFVNLLLWALMCLAYFHLALFEESSVLGRHGQEYERYLAKTWRFCPGDTAARLPGGSATFLCLVIATGFVCHSFSLRRLVARPLPARNDVLILAPLDYLPANVESVVDSIASEQGSLPGKVLLLYLIRGQNIRHLLIDSGLAQEAFDSSKDVRGEIFILAARAGYSCLGKFCPKMMNAQDALSAFAVRKPVGLYYLLSDRDNIPKKFTWSEDSTFAHASMPVL